MALSGKFIQAGVLYAGCDFQEWATRVSAVLSLQDLDAFTYAKAQACDFEVPSRNRGPSASRKAAVLVLCSLSFVDKAILARIPDYDKHEPNNLWRHYEQQAKPFRFLALPPELRNSIYEYSLGDGHLHTLKGTAAVPATEVHPLCKVSQQVRGETIPLYWAAAVAVYKCPSKGKLNAIGNEIIAWKNAHTMHVKYLTQCTLKLSTRAWYDTKTIHFSFDRNEGLRLEPDEGRWKLKPASLIRLQDYVAGIEQERKINEQQGECLLLALLSEPKLWHLRELEWQR